MSHSSPFPSPCSDFDEASWAAGSRERFVENECVAVSIHPPATDCSLFSSGAIGSDGEWHPTSCAWPALESFEYVSVTTWFTLMCLDTFSSIYPPSQVHEPVFRTMWSPPTTLFEYLASSLTNICAETTPLHCTARPSSLKADSLWRLRPALMRMPPTVVISPAIPTHILASSCMANYMANLSLVSRSAPSNGHDIDETASPNSLSLTNIELEPVSDVDECQGAMRERSGTNDQHVGISTTTPPSGPCADGPVPLPLPSLPGTRDASSFSMRTAHGVSYTEQPWNPPPPGDWTSIAPSSGRARTSRTGVLPGPAAVLRPRRRRRGSATPDTAHQLEHLIVAVYGSDVIWESVVDVESVSDVTTASTSWSGLEEGPNMRWVADIPMEAGALNKAMPYWMGTVKLWGRVFCNLKAKTGFDNDTSSNNSVRGNFQRDKQGT
ncbi:hypothetical protein C8R47DRAFT_1084979 [Mycena vitilis]|nr:hypothetical protein C8R47DRAFT_1084979 [Mycena vitilis]